ncbi:MAG: hypothetical protein HY816_15510 [Candidatus Wallbacteria bacterium]|nr:hypothetical protein [Candidatus Wallbacteria bacterium]
MSRGSEDRGGGGVGRPGATGNAGAEPVENVVEGRRAGEPPPPVGEVAGPPPVDASTDEFGGDSPGAADDEAEGDEPDSDSDEDMVEHVQLVTSLLEGREVSREEVLEMLERKRRQHSIGGEEGSGYGLGRPDRGPP